MRVAIALRVVAIALVLAIAALAWRLAGGAIGLAYLAIYALTLVPGLPFGFALFGRTHAAGWVTGALIGYGLTAILLWATIQVDLPPAAGIVAWAGVSAGSFLAWRHVPPLVTLPTWSRSDSLALALVAFIAPVLLWDPLAAIGTLDDKDNRRYRAYFTADFLWHVALTAELGRGESPPRNPYMARQQLNYYWAYFVPPAIVARSGLFPAQAALLLNALCAGVLFVCSLFVIAWCIVPRAGPVALAVTLVFLCASAEGAYAIWDLQTRGAPLSQLRDTNTDAITAWFFETQSIDSLPRSLWYTPQHAAACGLGLIGLIVAGAASVRNRVAAALVAGTALGLSLIFSPFLGGVFAVMYGATGIVTAARAHGRRFSSLAGDVARAGLASIPVGSALGWCLGAGTFEGAGGAIAFGLSPRAAAAPIVLPLLSIGPVLIPALAGVAVGFRRWPLQASIVGLVTGFFLLYFVTLTLEPIWVGWRAGQIILVTLPALLAAAFAWVADRSRVAGTLLALLVTAAGLPTTLIDWSNAHDVTNDRMGPGFRWTVVVRPDSQAALSWIRDRTPPDAVVQMSIGPRGRETWTLVPTFAERRMAAGKPISLLATAEYDQRSAEADAMFRTTDPSEAWQLARGLRLDYVYLDHVERQAFGELAIAKFYDQRYFTPVFSADTAAVFAVR